MGIKPLKLLIALDGRDWMSAKELSRITNLTLVEVSMNVAILRRLKMVEYEKRKSKNGEKIPPSYRSIYRKQ